jgi:hypothetical protein
MLWMLMLLPRMLRNAVDNAVDVEIDVVDVVNIDVDVDVVDIDAAVDIVVDDVNIAVNFTLSVMFLLICTMFLPDARRELQRIIFFTPLNMNSAHGTGIIPFKYCRQDCARQKQQAC